MPLRLAGRTGELGPVTGHPLELRQPGLAGWPVNGDDGAIQLGQRLRPELKAAAVGAEKNHPTALRKRLGHMRLAFNPDTGQTRLRGRPQPQLGQFGHKPPGLGDSRPGHLKEQTGLRHIRPKLRPVARAQGPDQPAERAAQPMQRDQRQQRKNPK